MAELANGWLSGCEAYQPISYERCFWSALCHITGPFLPGRVNRRLLGRIVCVFVIPRPRKDWHAVRRQRIAELQSQTNPRATTSCIGGAFITGRGLNYGDTSSTQFRLAMPWNGSNYADGDLVSNRTLSHRMADDLRLGSLVDLLFGQVMQRRYGRDYVSGESGHYLPSRRLLSYFTITAKRVLG